MPGSKCNPINGGPSRVSLLRKTGAEFLGTYIIVFIIVGGQIVDTKFNGVETLIGKTACAGLGVLIAVMSGGHISGGHFNPSITVGLAAHRQFPLAQVPGYLIAQFLGGICASFALKAIIHPSSMATGVTVPSPSIDIIQAFLLEFLITGHLVYVVTSVATDPRAAGQLAGIAIGGAVMANSLVGAPLTGASMNPARSLGTAIASGVYREIWIYMVAPILGGIAGTGAYLSVKLRDCDIDS